MGVQKRSHSYYVTIKRNEKTLEIEDYCYIINGIFSKYFCLSVLLSKVLAARKTILITARARIIKRSAHMLANARKDNSIHLYMVGLLGLALTISLYMEICTG